MKEGWKREVLKNACRVFTDGNWIQSKDQSTGGIRLVQTGNIGFGYFKNKEDKSRFISEETFERLKCTEILPGDLLVSRLPDPVGKSCIIPDLNIKMITGVDCTIIRPKDYLLSDYLGYFQMSNEYLKDVQSRVSGTTRSRISRKKLGLIEIPIPSLQEQKQIVAILDKAFTAIDQAKANISTNIENAKEFYENWVQEIFESPKKNWKKEKWGDLCHFVRGPFGGSLKKSMFKEEGYVVYEQKHAIHNHFNQLRYFIDEEKFNEMKRFEVKPGDIIMSCSGVTLGRVAIIPENIPRGIINQALLKLTPNEDVSVEFLKYWLRSNIFQNIIFEHAGGAAIPNVPSAKILKEIIIPFPSLSEQLDIVKRIETMLKKTTDLETYYSKKNDDLEELKKSILQKAFAGELTGKEVMV